MKTADKIVKITGVVVNTFHEDRRWWQEEFTYICRDTVQSLSATFGVIIKELKPWRADGMKESKQEIAAVAGRGRMEQEVATLNQILNRADNEHGPPVSRASVHLNHPDYISEQSVNGRFKAYCEKMREIYMESLDVTKGEARIKTITSADDDYFDHLQKGEEYASYLTLLERKDSGSAGVTGVEFNMLLRYLGFLEELMDDISSSEDDKEEADRLCVKTLELLCAQLDKVRETEDRDSVRLEQNEKYTKGDVLRAAQRAHAEAGAMKHCIRLLEDDEEDLLKAVMNYFARLLDNGNEDVQNELYRALCERKSTKALVNIRDEIVRSLATLSISSTHQETNQVLDELQNDEHKWLLRLVKGLQQICEGAYKPLQDILLDQSMVSNDKSINFVDVLAQVLQQTYTKIQPPDTKGKSEAEEFSMKKEAEQWLVLVEQVLETITEMCQGNQRNQQMVLDKRVISMLSWILAFDTEDIEQVDRLTKIKVAALTVIEAMLELSNEEAKQIAFSVKSTVNLEELYLAMNRFYYIALFICGGDSDSLMKDQPGEADKQMPHIAAARVCYHILRRLDDLTGTMYTWTPLKPKFDVNPDTKQRGGLQFAMQQSGQASSDNFDSSMVPKQRKEAVEYFGKADKAIWQQFDDDCKEGNINWSIASSADENKQNLRDRYVLFASTYLHELDTHGGEKMGQNVDRFWFFTATTVSIEFIRDDQLQKLYFCSPTEETTLSSSIRDETRINDLLLGSPQDKCRTLLEAFDRLRLGLKRQRWLKRYRAGRLIAEGSGVYHKWGHLLTTYILNGYMLWVYKAPTNPYVPRFSFPCLLCLPACLLACSLACLRGVLSCRT